MRRAYFGKAAGFIDTPVIDRAAIGTQWNAGPIIVEEYDSTCIIPRAPAHAWTSWATSR